MDITLMHWWYEYTSDKTYKLEEKVRNNLKLTDLEAKYKNKGQWA